MEWPISWWEVTDDVKEYKDGRYRTIFRNIETKEETDELPYGAVYASKHGTKGRDGLSLVCVIPTSRYENKKSHWYIDGRASNCTEPDDNTHRCWVRHGTFGSKNLHVDKKGLTCDAGAGSIAVEGFHGFLHHGVLKDC